MVKEDEKKLEADYGSDWKVAIRKTEFTEEAWVLDLSKNAEIEAEYGTCQQAVFPSAKICDAADNEIDMKCSCGESATTYLFGLSAMIGFCNKCCYDAEARSVQLIYNPPTSILD